MKLRQSILHTTLKSALYIILICSAGACTAPAADKDAATPRRTAYPRVVPPDTIRAQYTVGPAEISINHIAGAEVSDNWLTAHYTPYGATLYLSALHTASPADAIANRRQRISLNIGSATARTDTYTTTTGFDATIVSTDQGAATPVQFLAHDSKGNIISGAFSLAGSTSPADSIRPYVEILRNEAFDIINSIAIR